MLLIYKEYILPFIKLKECKIIEIFILLLKLFIYFLNLEKQIFKEIFIKVKLEIL